MRSHYKTLLASLIAGLLVATFVYSQTRTTIEDIVNNSKNYENSKVIVEGIVTRYVEGRGTTNYYLIMGNFGRILKVNTAEASPKINAKYKISGIVYRDRSTREPFISESSREIIKENGRLVVNVTPHDAIIKIDDQVLSGSGPWELSPGPHSLEVSKQGYETARIAVNIIGDQTTSEIVELNAEPLKNTLLYLIIGAIIILIILLVYSISRRKKEIIFDSGPATMPGKSTQEFKSVAPVFTDDKDFKTIKITKSSPPATLKFIPGKLVITDGVDEGKELKIAGHSSPEGSIVSIGRKEVSGEKAYSHIHLKENTVSRDQAEIIYREGKVFIKNLSQTNFTELNGEELTPGQMKELKDGSKIKTGEVEFTYQL